ncbi:MAG: hypothetical protein LCH69_06510 [Proteobacteria bacterium]|nr:hypothetical protein [Pseudomonadota bacterium]
MVEGGQIFFIRTDHIGRPVFATNNLGVKFWEASYLPCGGVHVATGGIALGLRPFGAENSPPESFPGAPHSPASGSRRSRAFAGTGCAITPRRQGGTSTPIRSGS